MEKPGTDERVRIIENKNTIASAEYRILMGITVAGMSVTGL